MRRACPGIVPDRSEVARWGWFRGASCPWLMMERRPMGLVPDGGLPMGLVPGGLLPMYYDGEVSDGVGAGLQAPMGLVPEYKVRWGWCRTTM